jgi:hypothetical protein
MKNFWLDRRQKREMEKKFIHVIKKRIRKFPGYTKGALRWPQQKKDTKTQP